MGISVLLFIFPALVNAAISECSLDELNCCLTEFVTFVSPAGISLSEQNVARVCTLKDETVGCMEVFQLQCSQNETDEEALKNMVNKTTTFINDVCPPTSDFIQKLKANEKCILDSSKNFQSCYNKTVLPDADKSKAECCGYKELRNCAVQTVENECGATAAQLVHEQVVNINGAVVEWTCRDTFDECKNSALMLASSVFFVLYKIALLKFLL